MDPEQQKWMQARFRQAEQRITQLETEVAKAKKRTTSGVAIIVFVILALVAYHHGWVKPLINSHNDLIDTFNENVRRHNENLYR